MTPTLQILPGSGSILLPTTERTTTMGARLASVKLSSQLVEDARSEGAIMNRSISGQLEYWATIGR
ncbi:hypothetical protein EOD15_33995, partial [Mesorhizobium sp. M7A.T.Ca.US.000.02.2.1]